MTAAVNQKSSQPSPKADKSIKTISDMTPESPKPIDTKLMKGDQVNLDVNPKHMSASELKYYA